MENKKILDEIEDFLEYLAKASEKNREENSLKINFGVNRYKKIYNLIGGKYTGALPKKEKGERKLILYINDNGLKFLEQKQEERESKNLNKATLFLTSILVLTTIASFFKDIIDKKLLALIYGIFAILILIYFKKSKSIKI